MNELKPTDRMEGSTDGPTNILNGIGLVLKLLERGFKMKKIIVVVLMMVVILGCLALPGFASDASKEEIMPNSVNAPEYAYPKQTTGMYADYMDYHDGEDAQNNVFTTDTLLVLSYVTDKYSMRWVRCQVIETIYETGGWRGYVREADLRIIQQ